MQTRYKILILLFTVTLVIGALALWHSSGDNDAVARFRSLFSKGTVYDLKRVLTSVPDRASLWYGGISLFAIVMIVMAFRAGRRDGPGARERLIELKPAKAQAGKMLHDRLLNESHPRHAGDAALERRIQALENELRDKEERLQSRDEELKLLRSRVAALADPPGEAVAVQADVESLRKELKRGTEILQAKEAIITELENGLTGQQQLLQSRSQELDVLKAEMNNLREQLADLRLAKEQTANVLQQELKKTKALQASIIVEQENSLSGKVQALESELSEKQELLQTRSKELKAAKSKVNSLRERLSAAGSAKNQTEDVLQQQLTRKAELLESKEAVLKELQESFGTRVDALEREIKEKEKLLTDRNAEMAALGSEMNSLMQELQSRTALLQAKDAMVQELQERLHTTVHVLENAQREVERLVRERDPESPVREQPSEAGPAKSRSDRKGMNSKLFELGAAKARAAASRQGEETKRGSESGDSTRKEPGEVARRDRDQQGGKGT